MNKTTRTCSYTGCKRPHQAYGLCDGHYRQQRNGVDLHPLRSNGIGMTLEQRFWSKVKKSDACWEWTGSITTGYGRIKIDGQGVLAHRFSWELSNGAIPNGMVVDHMCHNRACVNPGHLRVVTEAQNNQHLTGSRKNNKSGARGVYWRKDINAWAAQVRSNGRTYWGGLHSTIESADAAARALRAKLHTHDDHDEWVRRNGRSA